jgi:hypothetical protein
MEEISLSFWDILFLPISLPLRSAVIALGYLQSEVDAAGDSRQGIWESLLELEVLKEIGQVAEDEYEKERSRLTARLPEDDIT